MILLGLVGLVVVALALAIRAYADAARMAHRTSAIERRLERLEDGLAAARQKAPPAPAVARSILPPTAPSMREPVASPPSPTVPAQSSKPAATAAFRVPATASGLPGALAPADGPDRTPMGLETEIGSRWMLVVGVVVLVLGVAFFVKYAFDRNWIDETARVVIGTIAGLAVWSIGLRLARDYVLFGRIVAGGGLAMLFVSAWSATALYQLVPAGFGFAWVVGTSGLAALTAHRASSIGLALVAMIFAYGAPFVVPTATDRHLVLFVYESGLALTVLALAARHEWPALGVASWWLTWVTFGVWSARYYRDSIYLSTELYLIFVSAVFLAVMQLYRRSSDPIVRAAAYVLSLGPLFFHVASLTVLFNHALWFLTYLIAVSAICVSLARHRSAVRLLAWLAVAMPLVVWIERYGGTAWFVPGLVASVAIYVMHFASQLPGLGASGRPGISELLLYHANGLGGFLFASLLVDANAGSTTWVAAVMAAWHLVQAWRFNQALPAAVPHALALAFTLTAVTISLALTGPWLTAAYAAQGAAIVVVGVRSGYPFFRYAGAVLVAVGILRLIVLQFGRTDVSFVPVLNSRTLTGGFIVALLYGAAWLYRRYRLELRREAVGFASVAVVSANLLTVGLLTADVNSYWALRGEPLTADFARQLSVSVAWAIYAMGAIWIGFARASATIRYVALGLFGITVLKVFAVDLLTLDGVYRIAGFVALGLVLLAASFLYQRRRPMTSG